MIRLLLILGATIFLTLCGQVTARNYDFERTSADGKYQVKIQIRDEPRRGTRAFTENGTFIFFKQHQIVHTYEWNNSAEYEPSFMQSHPVVEWIESSVLRMGENRSDQPLLDELTVNNETNQHVKFMSLSYGKSEQFWIFDLAPNSRILVAASPSFKPDGSSNYSVGFGGETESFKKFEGVVSGVKRKSIHDGKLRLEINLALSIQ